MTENPYRYYHEDDEPRDIVTPEPQVDFWQELKDVMNGEHGDDN